MIKSSSLGHHRGGQQGEVPPLLDALVTNGEIVSTAPSHSPFTEPHPRAKQIVVRRTRRAVRRGARLVLCSCEPALLTLRMDRGGRRLGSGVKTGDKRGPYTKRAGTKKKSKPSDASTAMLAAFVASGNNKESRTRRKTGPTMGRPRLLLRRTGFIWTTRARSVPTTAVRIGSLLLTPAPRLITTTAWVVRAREEIRGVACGLRVQEGNKKCFCFLGPGAL